MTELSKLRLVQLKQAILKDNFYAIDFKETFHTGYDKTLGVDEFPHDMPFIMKFFDLTELEFGDIFIPKDYKVNTIDKFITHLEQFI